MKKVLLSLLLLSTAWGAYSQTTTTAAAAAAATTSSATGGRAVTPPPATAGSVVSSVEAMFQGVTGPLLQYGYPTFAVSLTGPVPRGRTPEPYVLGPGDQVTILLWGDPVDLGELSSQISITVAGDGTLFFAPVGQLKVDGVLRSDAEKSLIAGLAKKYKRFDLRLQVTPQRVFPLTVSGLVARPGLVLVDPWTGIPEVLAQVGGVQKNGTLRNLRLVKSDGREVKIDLYDLLIRGQKPIAKIEEGDVLLVGPIGKTVALYGQVKVPAIFEIKGDESLADVLQFAGGTLASGVGAPLTKTVRVDNAWVQSSFLWKDADLGKLPVNDGDVYNFRGNVALTSATASPGYVQVGGEITNAGAVAWEPGLTLARALELAGGVLSTGYLPGLTLTRDSVAVQQIPSIQQAISVNNAQLVAVRAKLNQASDSVVLAALNQELTARIETSIVLEESLTDGTVGRVQVGKPETTLLQPGDVVTVPRQNGAVILSGEIYNQGAQLWQPGMTVRAALDSFGGVKPTGNWDGVYLIHVNGRVESVTGTWNILGWSPFWGTVLQPGDIVHVPTKSADTSQGWALAKDIVALTAQTTTTVANLIVVFKTLKLID